MAVRLRSAPTFGLWAQGRPSEFASLKECKMLMSDDDDDCTHLSSRSVGRSVAVGRLAARPSLTRSRWRIRIGPDHRPSSPRPREGEKPVICMPSS